MSVGVLTIDFVVFGTRSLKDKRSIIQPFINKIRNNYNVSINELDRDDDSNRATIGFAHICSSSKCNHRKFSQIISEAERVKDLHIENYTTEVI